MAVSWNKQKSKIGTSNEMSKIRIKNLMDPDMFPITPENVYHSNNPLAMSLQASPEFEKSLESHLQEERNEWGEWTAPEYSDEGNLLNAEEVEGDYKKYINEFNHPDYKDRVKGRPIRAKNPISGVMETRYYNERGDSYNVMRNPKNKSHGWKQTTTHNMFTGEPNAEDFESLPSYNKENKKLDWETYGHLPLLVASGGQAAAMNKVTGLLMGLTRFGWGANAINQATRPFTGETVLDISSDAIFGKDAPTDFDNLTEDEIMYFEQQLSPK
jgi:hypothetical protein